MSSEVYAHCVGILQNCFTLRKTLCDVHSFVPSDNMWLSLRFVVCYMSYHELYSPFRLVGFLCLVTCT